MNRGAVGRFGLAAILAAVMGSAVGCASVAGITGSKGGWGPTPPGNGAPVAAQQGAPAMVQTTGMGPITEKQASVKVPSWIRVQDCAIVAISTPSRYACPDGRVYTGTELYQARSGS